MKLEKKYNIAFQLIIILVTYFYIYHHVFIHAGDFTFSFFKSQFSILNCLLLILLMLVNWGIEAYKWKYLIRKLEKLSFIKSITAVFSGVTISTFLPNRTGEYLGRVFILEKANRIHGILITIIGSISQLLITVCFGLISIIILFSSQLTLFNSQFSFINPHYLFFGLVFLNLVVVGICIIAYFNLASLIGFTDRIKSLKKYNLTRYLEIFSWYSNKELLKILFLSFVRYFVFTLEFYLLLRFLGISLPLLKAGIFISSVFFITTIIPSIAFTEPGLRGSVALSLFSIYFADMFNMSSVETLHATSLPILLVTATTVLWLLNLILPAVIGSLFIFRLKFFKNKYEV